MRVLHVLANGPPDVNGYAIRTKMILEHLNQHTDVEVMGLTSPWYPRNENMKESYDEEDIEYLRTPHPAQTDRKLPFLLRIARWIERRHQSSAQLRSRPWPEPSSEAGRSERVDSAEPRCSPDRSRADPQATQTTFPRPPPAPRHDQSLACQMSHRIPDKSGTSHGASYN